MSCHCAWKYGPGFPKLGWNIQTGQFQDQGQFQTIEITFLNLANDTKACYTQETPGKSCEGVIGYRWTV